jgi:hypothetical protein
MTLDEYNTLFHKLELNRSAFKQLMYCDEEVLKLVNYAIERACEACAQVCDDRYTGDNNREDMEARRCAAAIRARGTT